MKKVFYIGVCLLVLMQSICSPCFAGVNVSGGIGGGSYAVAPVDYSDITFYHNCDSLSDATKAVGSATMTVSSGILLNTTDKVAGTGCWDNDNASSKFVSFVTSGNLNLSSGRIGMYYRLEEAGSGGDYIFHTSGGNTTLRVTNNASGDLYSSKWHNQNGQIIDANMSTGTWYFIEFKFDGDDLTTYVDGVSKGTLTKAAATLDTAFLMFSNNSLQTDALIDQVIVSSNKDRDLYALRSITDFS